MKINTSKPYRIFAEVLEQGALDQFADFMAQNWQRAFGWPRAIGCRDAGV